MAGFFRVPGPLGITAAGVLAVPQTRAAASFGNLAIDDKFFLVGGGTETSPGIFKMKLKQPMVVRLQRGLTGDGRPLEVRCNDFSNPQGVATAKSLNLNNGDGPQFEITAKCLGHVMLEAREPTASGDWFSWPLHASSQVEVVFETAKEARKRHDGYIGIRFQVSDVTGKPRPGNIDDQLWAELLNLTKDYEGPVDFLYNDKGNPQRVTFGVGILSDSEAATVANRKYFFDSNGQPASESGIKADYAMASSLKREANPSNLYDFAEITQMRLHWDTIVQSLADKYNDPGSNARVWLRSGVPNVTDCAKEFKDFPRPAKLACLSIAYGGPNWKNMIPMWTAVKDKDWAAAAAAYWDPGWDPNKRAKHIELFTQAASASPPRLTPAP